MTMPPMAVSTPPIAVTSPPRVVSPLYAFPMVASSDAAATALGSLTSMPAASNSVRIFLMSAPAGRPAIAAETVAELVVSHWLRSVLRVVSEYGAGMELASVPTASATAGSETSMPASSKAVSASPMSAPEGTVASAWVTSWRFSWIHLAASSLSCVSS